MASGDDSIIVALPEGFYWSPGYSTVDELHAAAEYMLPALAASPVATDQDRIDALAWVWFTARWLRGDFR